MRVMLVRWRAGPVSWRVGRFSNDQAVGLDIIAYRSYNSPMPVVLADGSCLCFFGIYDSGIMRIRCRGRDQDSIEYRALGEDADLRLSRDVNHCWLSAE